LVPFFIFLVDNTGYGSRRLRYVLWADQAGVWYLSGYALQAWSAESVVTFPGDAFYLPYVVFQSVSEKQTRKNLRAEILLLS
jgi:hypothetical protein